MAQSAAYDKDVISFGPFTLAARERLLAREGAPIDVGARALDILIALSDRPNQVVSKRDLLAHVWPDVTVEEGSLRFHIANLRKVLGDGKDGARYITTLAGRGYCFVAPVSRSNTPSDTEDEAPAAYPQANLPNRLSRMVGRTRDARNISTRLSTARFVTIVGPGGVGKTTLAVAVGHELAASFGGAVHFVDLGALSDPALVTTTIASLLGLSVQSDDAGASLIAHLKDRRVLLILDTCEHLVEAVADVASRVSASAPQAHILATSREALRVEGEQVYRLVPLAVPPEDEDGTAAWVRSFPAAQLFLERAAANGTPLDLGDADAAVVGSICRKLDGVPLAIELAAGRAQGLGLERIAALLDRHLTLLGPGHRTAPPRQKTLQATLDWSYGLLTEVERAVLRRLAVFVGHFTIEAALDVVTSPAIDQAQVFAAIDGLVAKSMVAVRPVGAMVRYRLLDTTRAYALQTGIDDSERIELATQHAGHYERWLEQTGAEWATLASGTQRALHLAGIANVRAALEWCFGPNGSPQIGVRLAVAAAPVFLAMSLLAECHRWSERALAALDELDRGTSDEMHLQAALGVSLMFTSGGRSRARLALERSLEIAELHGSALDQLRLLAPLQMFHLRTGAFKIALHYSERCSVVAEKLGEDAVIALAHSLMGISLHLGGELDRARVELEAALRVGTRSRRTTAAFLGFDGRVLASAILARNLWLQGYPEQAASRARITVEEAAAMDHPLTLSIALIWATSMFIWAGDLRSANAYIERLFARAERHALGPYLVVGRGFKAEIDIHQGNADAGITELQACLKALHAAPYELLTTPLRIALIQGLVADGRLAKALALTDEAIQSVETYGDLCYLPELLRVRGKLHLSAPAADADAAERCFRRSLELSRGQGARAWELRTAIDLAALLAARDERECARAVLKPVFEHFADGPETADLKSAERLLATLG